MGNEAEDLNVDQLDEIIDQDGGEINNEEAEAAFLEEFDRDSGSFEDVNQDLKGSDDDKTDDDDDKLGDEDGGQDDIVDAKTDDDAGDKDKPAESKVDESEKDTEIASLTARLRKMEGKYGELNAKVTSSAKVQEVADKPSAKQIHEARQDGEKKAALREEFPEWAEALDEDMALTRQEILDSIPDNSNLKTEIMAEMDQKVVSGVLDITHKGWKDTINTPEFQDFSYQGGPEREERAVYFHLLNSDEPKAEEMFTGFMAKYPEWGEKYGVLLDSNNASDISDLLDQFDEHRSAQDQKRRRETNKKERLSRSTAATTSSSRPTKQTPQTAEQAFLDEFNS